MNFFFLSEHYFPRIGGVTTYVKETCQALAVLGHQVTLAVPGENAIGSIKMNKENKFKVLQFGTGISLLGDISASTRISFCKTVQEYLEQSIIIDKQLVIHNLFGLYLMEHFEVAPFKKTGKKIGVTIHNIPPEECGLSWKGDHLFHLIKDRIRKKVVRIVNKRRIKKQSFDQYIVPSQIVKKKLSHYINSNTIQVIGHGGDNKINYTANLRQTDCLKILTVAGFIPHKNQHLIPIIANHLKKAGICFRWDVVGPNKHSRYVNYVLEKRKEMEVEEEVHCHFSVPFAILTKFYQEANLYVQTSAEEGFCITTLDAAYYGLPIIGTKAGAIPEIIALSLGQVADTNPKDIANQLIKYIQSELYKNVVQLKAESISNIRANYNWIKSAQKLVDVYTF